MKYFLAALVTVHLAAHPVASQEAQPPSMMEEGAQQFLEGLLLEMEPALESMRGFMTQMGPALSDLMSEVKDWSVYEAPEILENGDIIIRRKPDADLPDDAPPQVDL